MHVLMKLAAALVLPAAMAMAIPGCGGGDDQPPLDEMTLRDVLLADPGVVAHLQKDARDRLRTRFNDQRLTADAVTEVTVSSSLPLLNQVVTMDAARFHAGRDALLTGAWQTTNTGAEAVPFSAVVGAKPQAPLPPLGGDLSGDTLISAERALEGQAGAIVEALIAMTGATKIERVTAWPIAALATMDTVYVNGSWLVAMDESATGCGSGGGSGGGGKTVPAGPPQNGLYGYLVSGDGSGQDKAGGAGGDGTAGDGTDTIEGQNKASGSDFCSSSSSSCSNSCNSASNSCSSASNSCSSASNSCSSASNSCSNSASSCSNSASSCSDPNNTDCDPTHDKECCRSCSMGGRTTNVVPQSPVMAFASLFWLLAPLGFLLMRENSVGAKLRRLHLRLLSSVNPS